MENADRLEKLNCLIGPAFHPYIHIERVGNGWIVAVMNEKYVFNDLIALVAKLTNLLAEQDK